jgi:hypothetical protein
LETPVMPVPPFVNEVRDLRHLAADQSLKTRTDAAENAEGIDTVADDQTSGAEVLLVQAVHFVTGKAGHDRFHACRVRRFWIRSCHDAMKSF